MRLPMGFSFPKQSRAAASLMIATREPAWSRAEKSRPKRNGVPYVSKCSGALHRTHFTKGSRTHAGNGVQPHHQLLRQARELRSIIAAVREIERDQQQIVAFESQIQVPKTQQISHKQARQANQYQGESHLRSDQTLAEKPMTLCLSDFRPRLQRGCRLRLRGAHSGRCST